jgi:hypothetical protein
LDIDDINIFQKRNKFITKINIEKKEIFLNKKQILYNIQY